VYKAPAVERAFKVIKLIALRDKCLTLSDLSRELGISKSTLHGIVRTLEGMGIINRDGKTRRYTLGLTLFELARTIHARMDLREIARPVMDDLMRSTQQTVFLGIRSGDHVSVVDIVESTQDFKITARIGARLPLMVGAIGKIFMASIVEQEARQLVRTMKLRSDTERSITDPDQYMEEVRRARDCGYALDDEEYLQGVRAVAASIHVPGHPESAIWVAGFTQAMEDEKMERIALETKRAAETISALLVSQENKEAPIEY
jgi:IclR family KDG regulon transcriptional repressor